MRIESIILSLLLHVCVVVLALFWPGDPPVDLQRQSYQVSLVMGAPGGEELPSPVLGPRPENAPTPQPDQGAPLPEARPEAVPELPAVPETPPEPAPQPDLPAPVEIPDLPPVAVPAPPEPEKPETPAPKEPEKTPKEEPAPQPEKTEAKKEEPKKEEPKKEEPKKEQPKKDEPKKETPKPATPPAKRQPQRSALDEALADVRREANAKQTSSAARALEELARSTGSGGVGGGGGSGSGPGGGGIYDVYVGQVILAVQPNWSMPTYSRENLVVAVRIKLAPDGSVLDCRIEQGSGRPDFDASAVNAVLRTKRLPPPPTPAQQDLIINFNAQQLAGR